MNFNGLKKTFPFMVKNKIPIFLWGSQGVGKTEGIKQIVKDMGYDIRVLYAGTQADPGDLIGLLHKDEKSGVVSHLPPSWFPKDPDSKGVIFLDELNRANPEVIQALFQFVNKGVLHTHQLPKGWYVMGAGNYNSDRFTVTDTSDSAWMSRFCHLDFTPSIEEWRDYVDNRGMTDISDFISAQPQMLELSAKDAGRLDTSFIVPDRRAWAEQVGLLEADREFKAVNEEYRFEIIAGCVGSAGASAYMSWLKSGERQITLKQIMTEYHKPKNTTRSRVKKHTESKNETRLDLLNQPIDELFMHLENDKDYLKKEGYVDNLKLYLLDLPKELAYKVYIKMSERSNFYGRDKIVNDVDFVKKAMS